MCIFINDPLSPLFSIINEEFSMSSVRNSFVVQPRISITSWTFLGLIGFPKGLPINDSIKLYLLRFFFLLNIVAALNILKENSCSLVMKSYHFDFFLLGI